MLDQALFQRRQRILHPTDFSEPCDHAFRLACALARDHKSRVILFHVVPPPIVVYGEGAIAMDPWETHESCAEKLRKLKAKEPRVEIEVRQGDGEAVPEILRIARETECGLIVMGTHGRTGLGRLLMGSVAEGVMRKAPCPVLTVKMPIAEAAASTEEMTGKVPEPALR